jgi:hypothetical protein
MKYRRVYDGLWFYLEMTDLSGAFLLNNIFPGCHNFTRHPVRYGYRGRR